MKNFGFIADKDEIKKIWTHNSKRWPQVTSPWRPSAGDIAIYEKFGGPKLSQKVLVLGSTPELRDLVSKYSSEHSPVVADASLDMLLAGTALLEKASPDREVWFKSDWNDLPLKEHQFDLILGDMVWWVLSQSGQQELAKTIKKLLKPDGLFLSRFRLLNESCVDKNPQIIIDDYIEKFKRSEAARDTLKNQLLSDLYDATVSLENKCINRDLVRLELSGAADKLEGEVADFLKMAAGGVVGANWTVQNRDEVLKNLTGHFKILEEGHASDYVSDNYPIFKLSSLS